MKNNEFTNLGMIQEITNNLDQNDITTPTTIQEKSIPLVLAQKDVICQSATGSGKTIAFGGGLIQNIVEGKTTKALILVPTRELAEQVMKVMKMLAKGLKLTICSVYGGVGYGPQEKNMNKSHIIVATPGRLLDHMQRGTIDMNPIQSVVLDEADRMLDMGFLHDVKKIFKQIKNKNQLLCFSATYTPQIKSVIQLLSTNAEFVKGEDEVDPRKLEQVYYDVDSRKKFSLLVHLMKQESEGNTEMIFTNSRGIGDSVAQSLKKAGVKVESIHGGLPQNKRKQILEQFQKKEITALVCTDIAARGLDIPHVTHVYNYDVPMETKQYVHRIGRTARAGKEGIAITLLASKDHDNFERLLRFEQVEIKRLETPQFEQSQFIMTGRGGDSRGGSRGGFGTRGRSQGGSRGSNRGGGFGRSRSSEGSRGGSRLRSPDAPRCPRTRGRRCLGGGGRRACRDRGSSPGASPAPPGCWDDRSAAR